MQAGVCFSVINISDLCVLLEIILIEMVADERGTADRQIDAFMKVGVLLMYASVNKGKILNVKYRVFAKKKTLIFLFLPFYYHFIVVI